MEEQIKVINEALQSIVNQMHELLSQPHLDLHIQFGECDYHFHMPTTKTEQDYQAQMREQFIGDLLFDAIEEVISNTKEENTNHAWDRILNLNKLIVRKEDMISPIAVEEYEVVRSEAEQRGSIALNEDAYQVKQELR